MDDENCPKCPYLVEKKCLCGKTSSKQPCSQPRGQCAFMCMKPSKCGAHQCQSFCHAPGKCADSENPCQKKCGKLLKSCSHPCPERCHAPYPCPESTTCSYAVTITCACGRVKEENKCGATRDKPRTQNEMLKCDGECARLKRNRDLASALKIDIDPATTTSISAQAGPQDSSILPYSDETLDLYIQSSSSSTLAALQGYEGSLHSFATQTSQRSTRFPPCRSQIRAFIHSLAADWGFQSESFDPEPVRHVLVYKAPGWVSPNVAAAEQSRIGIRGLSIAECIKLRDRERAKEKDSRRAAAEKARCETQQEEDERTAIEYRGQYGWSKVISKKPQWWNNNDTNKAEATPGVSQSGSGEGTNSGFGSGRYGSLVLKSGVGRGKEMKSSNSRPSSSGGSKQPTLADAEDVVEDWEQEAEKDEREQGGTDEKKEKEKEKKIPPEQPLPDDLPQDWRFEGKAEPYAVDMGLFVANN
ncbi:FKBP12-associated protein [Emydomyces testavorans]|uniref:FKBP12-associated protein n=1 Tax=Emydomyces testavorans TaxID=2070801 RepID=A0AAF0DEI6_9EURO|nr:FKBP12-associated protein [Emydomyces testavorans]